MSYANPKTAVVLVNLGTPDKPTAASVRRYLKEFLWDKRVIEGGRLRRILWWAVLNFIVLRVRPRKVARLYQTIWEQDSPMRKILNRQVAGLQLALQQGYPGRSPEVFAAMTYGSPGLDQCLSDLHQSGYRRILVMPLYPQFSATSTGPVYDKVADFQKSCRDICDIRILRDYFDHPLYIAALAESVEQFWQQNPKSEKLLLSFHGIPKSYADQGDPYPQQCLRTAELLATKLGLSEVECQASFQSRFGPAEWVKPYTDETLKQYGSQGVKSIDVLSPAFSADCLETLEEIAIQNKELFLQSGGESYRYIPALNATPSHIKLLASLVEEQAGQWLAVNESVNNG
ncbi:ferrochelatase [Motiliproteus sp. MSK22-1]|uniref:ferrochelatase n=1 Tax=Motiliproteus sp. MSK22-1 TaxID=1897630 RepID=UPI000976486B|nr:ferrochelatase [Motiliproteus sp. MSK22-1]OMH33759.1 ferrochelatase [Motiliproteus sp. MSK22-1]